MDKKEEFRGLLKRQKVFFAIAIISGFSEIIVLVITFFRIFYSFVNHQPEASSFSLVDCLLYGTILLLLIIFFIFGRMHSKEVDKTMDFLGK